MIISGESIIIYKYVAGHHYFFGKNEQSFEVFIDEMLKLLVLNTFNNGRG